MPKMAAVYLLLLVAVQVFASHTSKSHLVQRRQFTTEGRRHWARGDGAHARSPIIVHIALAQRNVDSAATSLMDVSNPDSPNYGQHWTPEQVAAHFSPSPEAVRDVRRWLNDSGIPPHRVSSAASGGYLKIISTAAEASKFLETRFYHFTRRSTGEGRIASDEYHVPRSLLSAIDYITTEGGNRIPAISPDTHAPRTGARSVPARLFDRRNDVGATVNCSVYTAPVCLREAYGIPQALPGSVHPNNSLGMYQVAWATWLPEDLDLFFQTFQPSLVGRRPLVEPVNSGYMQTDIKISPFNLEPNLNFEYAIALTSPQPITNIQVGDMYGGNINNMLAAFDKYYCGNIDPSIDPVYPNSRAGGWNRTADCGTIRPPKVLSITYGDSEANFPREYLERQCLEYLKLGLMGTTVVAASGDYGPASGFSPGTCIDPETGATNVTTGLFSPTFPASCPWLTSVGGTMKTTQRASGSNGTSNNNITTPRNSTLGRRSSFSSSSSYKKARIPHTNETAWSHPSGSHSLSSGGGFSRVFSMPGYQSRTVSHYLSQEQRHLGNIKGLYNPSGRAFPDISALAYGYLAAMHGKVITASGTSASAPVVAAMVSMINNERLNKGKGTLGFINPVLYRHENVMNDVVTGVTGGCGVKEAYWAVEGWDPVTGLGSLDYRRWRDVFLALP